MKEPAELCHVDLTGELRPAQPDRRFPFMLPTMSPDGRTAMVGRMPAKIRSDRRPGASPKTSFPVATPTQLPPASASTEQATPEAVTADDQVASRIALIVARSWRLARRMADAMNGAATLENPEGSPRLRNVMRVDAAPIGVQP